MIGRLSNTSVTRLTDLSMLDGRSGEGPRLTVDVDASAQKHPRCDLALPPPALRLACVEASVYPPLSGTLAPALAGIPASLAIGEVWGILRNFLRIGEPGAIRGMRTTHELIGAYVGCHNACLDAPFYQAVHGVNPCDFNDLGSRESRASAPWWNVAYYKARYIDIGSHQPILHMLTTGLDEGRQLAPHFDPQYYFERYADLTRAFGHLSGRERNAALLRHYVVHGLHEGRTASRDCCARAYLERYPHLKLEFGGDLMKGLTHLYKFGLNEGLNPAPIPDLFDEPRFPSRMTKRVYELFASAQWMRQVNHLDNPQWGEHLLFREYSDSPSVCPGPWYDPTFYKSRHEGMFANDREALFHFLHVGLPAGEAGSVAFDPVYYLVHNNDVLEHGNREAELLGVAAEPHLDALRHWAEFGIREGRAGSSAFNPAAYHQRNPDVGPVSGHDAWGALRHHFEHRHVDPRPLC